MQTSAKNADKAFELPLPANPPPDNPFYRCTPQRLTVTRSSW
jgi:hypothetical protein